MSENDHYGKSIRKIIKIGDCLGVTIPKRYWEHQNLKRGDYVEVVYNSVLKIAPFYIHNAERELGEGMRSELRGRSWKV